MGGFEVLKGYIGQRPKVFQNFFASLTATQVVNVFHGIYFNTKKPILRELYYF